jgi:hypothetical protein
MDGRPRHRVADSTFDQGQARVATASAELRQSLERYRALAVEIRSQVREA